MAKGLWRIMILGGVLASVYWLASHPDTLDRCASYCMYPVLMIQRTAMEPLNNYMGRKRTERELEVALRIATQEKEDLLAQLIQLRAAAVFMDEIREIIDFKERYGYAHALLVQVLAKNISEQEHFFLVSAGSEHGVEKDMIAVYKNGILGRIVAVYPWYSKLLLITDRSCKVAALCANSKAMGIHEGMNDITQTVLTRVSHLDTVEIGDFVLSTGDGLIFPKGFALGTVASSEVDDLYYRITVKPMFDIMAIDYCYLMRKETA